MIDEIKQALAAATPGPWEVMNGRDIFTQTGATNRAGIKSTDMDGWHIADVYSNRTTETSLGEVSLGMSERLANAHLIANAPEWLRYLLGEVERLEKALEEIASGTIAVADAVGAIRIARKALEGSKHEGD